MLSKSIRILLFVSVLTIIALPLFSHSQAAEFTRALIRLDRLTPNTATASMVCAEPTTNATEGRIAIIFPTGFSVNATAGNWTVSTAEIPAGTTAWPGISTATSVSGQTVTFPSGNLNIGTHYCFTISGTNTLTTSSTGEHVGSLITQTAGGTNIDISAYAVNITANDSISVTAEVAATPTDFDAELELTAPLDPTVPQETTLTYELTYGSHLDNTTNITVEAEWSLGTISGSGTPTVDILDYVVGSASNGYNAAPPVVDLINRKITWTIPSFPANTAGETVTFQLKTNDSYTGSETVSFDVSGRVVGPGTQTADSTVTINYQYNFGITPTPTPTVLPTNTPGASSTPGAATPSTTSPTATQTPTPTPIPITLQITDINIRGLSPTSADIFVAVNTNARVTVSYGTSPTTLTSSVTSASSPTHLVSLPTLTPGTTYYFRVTATNDTTQSRSELFTFTTPVSTSPVTLLTDSFLVFTNRILIFDARLAERGSILPLTILPTDTPFTFSLSFANFQDIFSLQAFLRSQSDSPERNRTNTSLLAIQPGEFTGSLMTPALPGHYALYVRITDILQNLFEEKLAELHVVSPFTVLEESSLDPIEGATITLWFYNPETRVYEFLDPHVVPVINPVRTKPDGTADLVLPQGEYKAKVSAFLYEDKTIEFTLGVSDTGAFPTVYLKREPFNPVTWLLRVADSFKEFYASTTTYLSQLNASYRTFELTAFFVLLITFLITLQSFLSRTHMNPSSLYHYLKSLVLLRTNRISPTLSRGVIYDAETEKPLARAFVSLVKNGKVIAQTMTNARGMFFTNKQGIDHIEISKVGFTEQRFPFSTQVDQKYPSFYLTGTEGFVKGVWHKATDIIHVGVGFIFEFLVFVLLLLEILFIPTFGILKVAPFLLLTIAMIAISLHHALLLRR